MSEFRAEQAIDLRVGVTRSKEIDEVVVRVSPVHVESQEAAIFGTRLAVEALQSHSAVASQKVQYVGYHGEKTERVCGVCGVRQGLEMNSEPV